MEQVSDLYAHRRALSASAEGMLFQLGFSKLIHHLLNTFCSFRSISRRVSLHSPGYSRPARNAAPTSRRPPIGSMIFSMDSGKAKCVPCSYNKALNLQLCGFSVSRFSMRRIYLHVSHRTSSSAPMQRTFPCFVYFDPTSASASGSLSPRIQ